MESSETIICKQFVFFKDFDSANLAEVEYLSRAEKKYDPYTRFPIREQFDAEFNIWTKPDAWGTPHETSNRTWFYFGVQTPPPSKMVRFNMVDLNKQEKLFQQGMAPVYRVSPGKFEWQRIPGRIEHYIKNDCFTISFKFRVSGNKDSITYFAFTYPFTYQKLQDMLIDLDGKYFNLEKTEDDDIYYVREIVTLSIEGRNVDLITISSHHGITSMRETRLKNLFLDYAPRPFQFYGKKVIFVSARVHPGETPCSFVFDGLLKLLLNQNDPVAKTLRKRYVFKLMPCLNPDGVAKGHYRTDSKGVNLNRVYLNPSYEEHPSIYAARALIRYYHFGCEKEDVFPNIPKFMRVSEGGHTDSEDEEPDEKDSVKDDQRIGDQVSEGTQAVALEADSAHADDSVSPIHNDTQSKSSTPTGMEESASSESDDASSSSSDDEDMTEDLIENSDEISKLFMYLDLHAHVSKLGIFMYGNHFDDIERNVECMLFPKLMSLNSRHFDFNNCNFTARRMCLKDRTNRGGCRTGSGRVAVLLTTGITRSYTLECNYNTGKAVSHLPSTTKSSVVKTSVSIPPRYTPKIFRDVGVSIGAAILDMTDENPRSRLPNNLGNIRQWLRRYIKYDEGDELLLPEIHRRQENKVSLLCPKRFLARMRKL